MCGLKGVCRGWRAAIIVWLGVVAMAGCDGSANVLIDIDTRPPADVPQNLQAHGGSGVVVLGWDEVEDADGYYVYWRTSPGVTERDNVLPVVAEPAASHAGLSNGVTYYYRVASSFLGVQSGLSAEVSATPTQWSLVATLADRVNAMAGGGARFVAVGEGGTISTSDDGELWSARSSGTTATLRGVARGAWEFVAVGDGGSVLLSSDGTSWSRRDMASPEQLNAVIWDGDRYVVVGKRFASLEAGIWLSSTPDSAAFWSAPSTAPATGLGLLDVAWSGARYVAVGEGGYILSSTDGAGWSRQGAGMTLRILRGVVWGERRFVAVGDGGTILSSEDGTLWSRRLSGTNLDLNAVYHDGARFIAVGEGGVLLTSAEGVNWVREVFPFVNPLFAVHGNETLNLLAGESPGGGPLFSQPR